jgi:hypothetical protein
MAAVIATVVCPVCGQCIYEAPCIAVALAHCDALGRACPFSGQPFGAVAPSTRTLEVEI